MGEYLGNLVVSRKVTFCLFYVLKVGATPGSFSANKSDAGGKEYSMEENGERTRAKTSRRQEGVRRKVQWRV